MSAATPKSTNLPLARQAREKFVQDVGRGLPEIAAAVGARLTALTEVMAPAREMQEKRDAWLAFQKHQNAWAQGSLQAWQKAIAPLTATTRVRLDNIKFELIGDEVMENKILASRLALPLLDKVGEELNDLRLRMLEIEGTQELAHDDILRPEISTLLLVERWILVGLSR